MITREEIELELINCETEYGFNPQDVYNIIDKIYKSVEEKDQAETLGIRKENA